MRLRKQRMRGERTTKDNSLSQNCSQQGERITKNDGLLSRNSNQQGEKTIKDGRS